MAAPPNRLTTASVAPEDLTAEIRGLLTAIEAGLSSDAFREHLQQRTRQATQIAIFSQALADHESETPLKKYAADMRDAALALTKSLTPEDTTAQVAIIRNALAGKSSGTAPREMDWSHLAKASAMMGAMKERSEAVRRGLRRPRDPDVESRHALAIALMSLVVHGDTHAVKNPDDQPLWQETSLELHRHLSRAAASIKSRDPSAADHFRLGMEACDKCHEKFKP